MNEQTTAKGFRRNDLANLYKEGKEKLFSRIKRDSNSNHRMPMKITHQHKELVDFLRTKLDLTSQLIIAIDGVDGAGKSSFAHYLAFHLNVSVIETDICSESGASQAVSEHSKKRLIPIAVDPEILTRLMQTCKKRGKPVIVEGIYVLQSLEASGINPGFLISMERLGWSGSFDFTEYNEKYSESKPDYKIAWSYEASINNSD